MSFTYSLDKLSALEATISVGRLAPYLESSGGELESAIHLYELNARLSSMLYTPLQSLEVSVRNAIDRQLGETYGVSWSSLAELPFQRQQADDLRKAIDVVSKDDMGNYVNYTHDDVVAELNFGFWVGLLGPKNEVEIYRKSLWKAFPNRPKGTERKAIQGALNSVRRLRNRIAHHCRIIHRDLAKDHDTIIDVIGWICGETRDWTLSVSAFDANLVPVPQSPFLDLGLANPDPLLSVKLGKAELPPTRDGRKRLGLTG